MARPPDVRCAPPSSEESGAPCAEPGLCEVTNPTRLGKTRPSLPAAASAALHVALAAEGSPGLGPGITVQEEVEAG